MCAFLRWEAAFGSRLQFPIWAHQRWISSSWKCLQSSNKKILENLGTSERTRDSKHVYDSSVQFLWFLIKRWICGNAFNLCRRVFSKFCVIYECFWQTRKCCQSFRPEQLFFNEDVSRFSMFYGSKKPPEGKRSGVPKSFQTLLQFPHLYDSNQGLLWRFMALLKHAKKQQRNCVIKGGLKRGNYYLWGKLARP